MRGSSAPASSSLPAELLTTAEAAARLKYAGPKAARNFQRWADRHRVPRLHRGSVCLWEPHVLMAFLRRDKWTLNRHGESIALAVVPAHRDTGSR